MRVILSGSHFTMIWLCNWPGEHFVPFSLTKSRYAYCRSSIAARVL